jgi:hypothetical protein
LEDGVEKRDAGKARPFMDRALVYTLLVLTVVGSCLIEYSGVRLLSSLPARKQTRAAFGVFGACVLALALFGSKIVVTDCLVLAGALAAGALLSRQIGSLGALSTMLIVAAIVDLISAHAGPSRWLVNQAQQARGVPALQFLAVSLELKGRLVPVIGVGDLMFFAAVVSVVRRLGWSEASAFAAPLAGILAALGVGLFTGFTPALPFLAVAVLVSGYALNSPRR